MLNHSSRELLQLMVVVEMKLQTLDASDDFTHGLIETIENNFKAIEGQIVEVSNYLSSDAEAIRPTDFELFRK